MNDSVDLVTGIITSVGPPLMVAVGGDEPGVGIPLGDWTPDVGRKVGVLVNARTRGRRYVIGPIGIDSGASGFIATAPGNGIINTTSGGPSYWLLTSAPLVFTMRAHRIYELIVNCRAMYASASSMAVAVSWRNSGGGATRPWGDSWHNSPNYYYGGWRSSILLKPLTDETCSVEPIVECYAGGTGQIFMDGSSYVAIEDKGPQ